MADFDDEDGDDFGDGDLVYREVDEAYQEELRRSMNKRFEAEREAYLENISSPEGRAYDESQRKIMEDLLDIRNSETLDFILQAELSIQENELALFCNSTAQRESLEESIVELECILKHAGWVCDPQSYEGINRAFSLPRNRLGGLPYDEARQSFLSHSIRIMELLCVRMTHAERDLKQCRLKSLRVAWKMYMARQREFLDQASTAVAPTAVGSTSQQTGT